MTNFTDTIPHLNIEFLKGGLIRLENESMGDCYAVDIHPVQLRLLAEKAGIIRETSASEANTLRTNAELRRRLRSLKDRIDHLGEYLALHSDHRHADLTFETTYATATADICDAYCADFPSEDIAPSVQQRDSEAGPAGDAQVTAMSRTQRDDSVTLRDTGSQQALVLEGRKS